ncbi:MAG TPA: hypothetical protein PLS41_09675 [Bacteroidales bacterium]|nr:hypothetical protein [Bacteroidales bacterium]
MRGFLLCIIILFVFFQEGCRKSDWILTEEITVYDNGLGTGTVTWNSKNRYYLDGLVFVNDGQTLTIEPGTVILGRIGQGSEASALIVARGGKVIAQGTPEAPIIFSVEGDDLSGSIPVDAIGLWGGVIILGNAPLNASGREAAVEGIPISEPRGIFGGDDPDDNSGIFEYVSIRHGGTSIDLQNEINGLTLGGVGRNTSIHHVEIISCADDGVEIFGGTVNLKYMISAFCEDDAFDMDMGYHGKGQFWLAIQHSERGNCILEIDGSNSHLMAQPFTQPIIHNLTAIGKGIDANGQMILFSTNSAGMIHNSIFVQQQHGISFSNYEGIPGSIDQWFDNNLSLSHNSFWEVAENTMASVVAVIGDNPGSEITDSLVSGIIRKNNGIINQGINILNSSYLVFPTASEPVFVSSDSWFDAVSYRGAFNQYNWASGWSLLHREGYIEE